MCVYVNEHVCVYVCKQGIIFPQTIGRKCYIGSNCHDFLSLLLVSVLKEEEKLSKARRRERERKKASIALTEAEKKRDENVAEWNPLYSVWH